MPTDAELKVAARVKDLLREALEVRCLRRHDVAHVHLLRAALSSRYRSLKLASLVALAEDLGYDVVLNFRERPTAQAVQKG